MMHETANRALEPHETIELSRRMLELLVFVAQAGPHGRCPETIIQHFGAWPKVTLCALVRRRLIRTRAPSYRWVSSRFISTITGFCDPSKSKEELWERLKSA